MGRSRWTVPRSRDRMAGTKVLRPERTLAGSDRAGHTCRNHWAGVCRTQRRMKPCSLKPRRDVESP